MVLMTKFKHHIPIICSFSSKFSRKENFEPGNLVKGFEFFFFSVLWHPVSCVTFETGIMGKLKAFSKKIIRLKN